MILFEMYHFNLQPSEVLFHLFLKYHTPSPPPPSYLYFVRIKAEGGEGGHVLSIGTRPALQGTLCRYPDAGRCSGKQMLNFSLPPPV